ncbi:MAG: cytochrome c biogenesis protein ResB [Bacillota bacterium]
MKFGLILLGILGIMSAVGSLIPQGREISFYSKNFSPIKAKIILSLKLDNLYHSPFFMILFSALCLNLFLCSVSRVGTILKNLKNMPGYETMKKLQSCDLKKRDVDNNTMQGIFEEYGFKSFSVKAEGDKKIYSGRKSPAGYLGSWLIHLGILVVILFYAYGQSTYFTTAVYGTVGISSRIEGTELEAKINSFHIRYRADGSVEQYVTNLDLLKKDHTVLKSADISVNKPMNYKGYNFYQTSTGWTAAVRLLKNNKLLTEQLLYEGEVIEVPEENIAVQFSKFYPDFSVSQVGFYSKSDEPNNPIVLYTLFYRGRRVGMDIVAPGSQAAWNEYQILFEKPQRYTYLQVNKMNGKLGALAGALLMTAGLVFAFYLKPQELVIVEHMDKIHIYGKNINKSFVQKTSIMQNPTFTDYPLQQ